MGDVQDDIESKAEELNHSSADQHLGDAMDDADRESASDVKSEHARHQAKDGQDEDERYAFPPEVDGEPNRRP